MEDPDMASPPPGTEDPDPDPTSLQLAMEVPITALLGPVGPLLRKLYYVGPEHLEVRPLMVLCISLKDMSEDEAEASIMARWWMKLVRELCYDVEDHLDEVVGAGAHLDFSEFLARAKDASERRERFQWSPLKTIKPADLTSPELPVPVCGRSTVGVVEPPKKLVELLALDDDDHKQAPKVISISGCAGIGKTTVARTLYHNHGGKFQCRAFVIVSQNPDMRAFLTSMLSQLKAPLPHGFPDVPDLIDAVSKQLQGKRYFIVVDDLWTASVWDIISSAFPGGDRCCRIITTTQIDDVALACCSYESDCIYKMKPLNDDDSRKLFIGRVFGSEDACPKDVEEVSYEIIRKCGGLPLAIVNMASLFASESNLLMDSLSSTSEGMKDVLNLIYHSLPPRLRTCLLYLSMYGHGHVIKKDELVLQWVAEGFLGDVQGRDTEEIAGDYFDELVSRGMVQSVDTNNNGKVLSCTVHQMVLDFIQLKSMEENFIITVDYFQSTLALPDKVRRLSVQFGGVKSAYIPQSIVTSQVRSLIFWGFFKSVPYIRDYGPLRVLILHIWADRDKKSFDLMAIGKLFQLKYLKVECNITVKLPGKIRRLQHLGTLQVDARLSAVPSDIVNLKRLLHLRVPSESILPSVIAHMTSLRTLGYFDLSSHSEENVLHLGGLTNLQDLQLTCSIVQPAENLERNVQLLGSILEKLSILQSLTLVPAASSSSCVNIPKDGFSMASPPPDLLLQRIELSQRCCIFFSLPKWFGELRKLCILKITIRRLSMNNTDMLKGLPSLATLTLYIQTAPAERIFIDEGGFQVLTYFKFTCATLCLSFMQGAMPKVQKLKLGFNYNEWRSHTFEIVDFCHLTDLTEVSVKLGARGADEFDIKAAKSALEDAVSNHPNSPIIRLQCSDVISYGDEDKSTTPSVFVSSHFSSEPTSAQLERTTCSPLSTHSPPAMAMDDVSFAVGSSAAAAAAAPADPSHGWQKVTYVKCNRKHAAPSAASSSSPDLAKPKVFEGIDKRSQEHHRAIQATRDAAADYDDGSTIPWGSCSEDNGGGSDSDEAGRERPQAEVPMKPKKPKVKKPKVTVAAAAALIYAENLTAYLVDISASYENQEGIQLMRFADYFGLAFASVRKFPWAKMFMESPITKMVDVPLCHVPEPVCKTASDWISQRSPDALGEFVLWCIDSIMSELSGPTVGPKGSKKVVHQTPKAQVAIFVVLALTLRTKPDVVINLSPKIVGNRKYLGQKKLPIIVWVINQASQGDLVSGMFCWSHSLFPTLCAKSSGNPQSRDLVLQLLESFLSTPNASKARAMLLNGAVRKGQRLVPAGTFDLFMRGAFPVPNARVMDTERFEAAYPIIKELALAGTPGTKTVKQVSQQLLPLTVKAMQENNAELTREAADVFIWCLTQSAKSYKQWEKFHAENIEASVAVLRKITADWKTLSPKLNSKALKATLKNLKAKNEVALEEATDSGKKASIKEADKYCKAIIGRLSRGATCLKGCLLVIALAIAAAATAGFVLSILATH